MEEKRGSKEQRTEWILGLEALLGTCHCVRLALLPFQVGSPSPLSSQRGSRSSRINRVCFLRSWLLSGADHHHLDDEGTGGEGVNGNQKIRNTSIEATDARAHSLSRLIQGWFLSETQ